ncbi:hypothetical protein [Streptomyces sp. NPDC050560]|uniref:hypothetical protein n=1 Tax=Streptomyces sp. NPDC050560 TaxID=3365630 RepID=UPI0037A24C57
MTDPIPVPGAQRPMSHASPRNRAHGPSAPLPATIWLPDPAQSSEPPAADRVLPDWATAKIRSEFARRPGHPPAPLLRISIPDTAPGMDTRIRCTLDTDDADTTTASLLLGELHPDALPAPGDRLAPLSTEMSAAMENGWPGFFHRAHCLLPANGTLLLAARQRRSDGTLADPLGSLIAAARTAGFTYLQHIVIAHARPDGDSLVPSPPDDADPGVTHSDLIVFSAIHYA